MQQKVRWARCHRELRTLVEDGTRIKKRKKMSWGGGWGNSRNGKSRTRTEKQKTMTQERRHGWQWRHWVRGSCTNTGCTLTNDWQWVRERATGSNPVHHFFHSQPLINGFIVWAASGLTHCKIWSSRWAANPSWYLIVIDTSSKAL